ncbi:MAG: DNA polymerase III subunit delta' [Cyanothece sp. SIO2G6]|nr:DNA polymerase III subunit delta' [Cyanothece sp. SIO2G6]
MVTAVFDRLIGQPQAVRLLGQAIAHNRIAPGYLFVGPNGIGKRLAAECFVHQLLQPRSASLTQQHHSAALSQSELSHLHLRIQQRNHPDLFWVEPTYTHQGKQISMAEAEERGLKRRAPPILRLEQIRTVTEFLSRPSLEAPQSVVVLEQTETMAEAAANALLKTLEEPGNATLILIAPSVDSLLPTLISRCQIIPFRRLDRDAIAHILQNAGYGHILTQPHMLDLAQGSPGEAIASWQKSQAIEEQSPSLLEHLQQPPTSIRQALTLGQTIAKQLDPETQLWLIGYLQQCYWRNSYRIMSESTGIAMHPLIGKSTVDILETARQHLRRYVQPRLVWEVALMKLVMSNRIEL